MNNSKLYVQGEAVQEITLKYVIIQILVFKSTIKGKGKGVDNGKFLITCALTMIVKWTL